jgi:hypothetical protein
MPKHPWAERIIHEPPALMRLVENEGAQLKRAESPIPKKLAAPLGGMIAAGWVPPGAATESVVERLLKDAWLQIRKNSEPSDGTG